MAGKDDVGFIGALIEHTIANHDVDPDRVYLIVVSRGGWMAYAVAIEIPHKLTAFSVVLARGWRRPAAAGCLRRHCLR